MAENKNPGGPPRPPPPPQLTAVAEKTLPATTRCRPGRGTLAYCPTMDLIALAAEDGQLHVFRLNGQRVFGGSFGGDPSSYLEGGEGDEKGKGELRALRWKNNGIFVYPAGSAYCVTLTPIQATFSPSPAETAPSASSAPTAARRSTITRPGRRRRATQRPAARRRNPSGPRRRLRAWDGASTSPTARPRSATCRTPAATSPSRTC
ncbi:hypothetical protein VTN02DRAFT_6293 [Thermoascus thermophilus]